MHIILVSNRLATAKTFVITPRFVAAALVAFFAAMFCVSALFSWLSVQFRLPFLENLVISVQRHETERSEAYVRDNLNAMAARLGQMQADLMHLDALSERVSSLAGVKGGEPAPPPEVRGGQGGPLLLPKPDAIELNRSLDRLAQRIDYRLDAMTALEQDLMEAQIRKNLLPTVLPVHNGSIGSGFGWRVDPIVGVGALHEGLDFQAEVGTPVYAAAGGVVVTAEYHPQYGNLIEIEHGNDFSTRYAHLSRIAVKPGQVVRRDQNLGLSGNTGRSTGPHLHFEVRYKGVAQNPTRFLRLGENAPQLAQRR